MSDEDSFYSSEDENDFTTSSNNTYVNRFGRTINPTEEWSSYKSFITTQFVEETDPDNVPKTVKEAMNSDNEKEWVESVFKELLSIIHNKVVDILKGPSNRKIIRNEWVYALKKNDKNQVVRYKSRL